MIPAMDQDALKKLCAEAALAFVEKLDVPFYCFHDVDVMADADGIADAWELARGLNPKDARDNTRVLASGYTAIEEYLNELARPAL